MKNELKHLQYSLFASVHQWRTAWISHPDMHHPNRSGRRITVETQTIPPLTEERELQTDLQDPKEMMKLMGHNMNAKVLIHFESKITLQARRIWKNIEFLCVHTSKRGLQ
jgi:hypothetical protein